MIAIDKGRVTGKSDEGESRALSLRQTLHTSWFIKKIAFFGLMGSACDARVSQWR